MSYMNITKTLKGAYGALFAVALMAGPSFALTYNLAAVEAEWTPPGTATPVSMWGFVADTGTCPATPVAWDVGPLIDVPAGEDLTINLRNCLSEAVSVFIPGQVKTLAPVREDKDGSGRMRVTSFDTTAPADNGATTTPYTWVGPKEGTYLYQSGTFVAKQVPKGLYGALVVRGSEYPTVAQEGILVYSEIDPDLNNAGVGARVNNYLPKYFLINGDVYPNTGNIAFDTGEDILLRFLNAGLRTYVPTLQGLYMRVIAEDGNLFLYPNNQYQLELTAAKTMDVLINAGTPGMYALYDRSLHLSNAAATGGGMHVYLDAGAAAGAPTANNDSYTVVEDGSLTADGVLPNPAGVLANDTGGAVEAVLVGGPSAGTLSGGLASDGSFSYTPSLDFNGSDFFTYAANDGAGGANSNAATVTITVTAVNDAPVALADSYDAVEGQVLNVAASGVLGNDTDVDGDALTASPVGTPAGLTMNPDGSFSYTPAGVAGAVETFEYVANDSVLDSASAIVTINVTGAPANIAPTANDDFGSTSKNTALVNFNIVANDVDTDGTIDPTSVAFIPPGTTTTQGGTVVSNGDGTVTYTPKPGFRGTDTFVYTVDDNDGATSNQATVRINVLK
ncbi:MAG: Ig-like domain-containing protein [Desulfobulbaceae bacterium]|nr:Ig-like domain-containing protein [Desulfobulbaceae bacterium]